MKHTRAYTLYIFLPPRIYKKCYGQRIIQWNNVIICYGKLSSLSSRIIEETGYRVCYTVEHCLVQRSMNPYSESSFFVFFFFHFFFLPSSFFSFSSSENAKRKVCVCVCVCVPVYLCDRVLYSILYLYTHEYVPSSRSPSNSCDASAH